jgi:hypothetical protein
MLVLAFLGIYSGPCCREFLLIKSNLPSAMLCAYIFPQLQQTIKLLLKRSCHYYQQLSYVVGNELFTIKDMVLHRLVKKSIQETKLELQYHHHCEV